jgi:prevent-host-death family protein
MVSVGVRELRQRASELLRQVQRGETIEITDRGRPVALLGPVPEGSALERLRDAGQVVSADGSLDDLPDPLRLEDGQEAPSSILARLRHDDR